MPHESPQRPSAVDEDERETDAERPPVSLAVTEDIDLRFTYHPPTPVKIGRHEHIRDRCKALAFQIGAGVPEGRERSMALSRLEEVAYWANAGIAREGV